LTKVGFINVVVVGVLTARRDRYPSSSRLTHMTRINRRRWNSRLTGLALLATTMLSVAARADGPATAPASAAATTTAADGVRRTEDVIYHRKVGTALTLDVYQPAKPNGLGVIAIMSGGWYSSRPAARPGVIEPALARGYTVFTVVHGSQPTFHIPEIAADLHRAVRFVRHNAARWDVDPARLGLTGMSAGGHLTLTIATQGGPGDPAAADPVDRQSSAVQAAVAFFPPTDFLNYGKPGADAVGVGVLKDYHGAFGPAVASAEERKILGRAVSPANFVTDKLPPTLLIHGDADLLVPVQQSRLFAERAKAAGAPVVTLVEKPGKAHGWPDMKPDLEAAAAWFDEHLKPASPAGGKP
jgi:acetyl esterase/lipase